MPEAGQGPFQAATEVLHQEPERDRHTNIVQDRGTNHAFGQQTEVKARHDLVARQVPCNILQDVKAEEVQ